MNAQIGVGYGQALSGQFVAGNQFSQPETPPPVSIMEGHLSSLRALSTGLYSAVERSTKIADRLMGQEPQNIVGGGNGPKDAMEPPRIGCWRSSGMRHRPQVSLDERASHPV